MGLAKLGMSLVQKTSVWVKAAGKTSALQTKPLSSVKKLEGLNLASIKQDIAVFSNKIKAVEPYKSLLVRECDKPVNTIYFKNYLSEKEIRAFEKYIETYGNNNGLRDGDIVVGDAIRAMAFKKAQPLSSDAYVYRGISRDSRLSSQKFLNSFKEGASIVDEGLLSTSTSLEHIKNTIFLDNAINSNGILLRIHLPAGTKGILLDYNEYLLPNSSKLKINLLTEINGIKIGDCEYILPNSQKPEYIENIRNIAKKYLNSEYEFDKKIGLKVLNILENAKID